jgi:site-specific recombinase XerD
MGTSIETLATSWKLSLRSRRRSPKTVRSYLESLEQLRAFLVAQDMPTDVDKVEKYHVESFIVDVQDHRAPATAAVRYRSLQQFFKWAVAEDEIDDSPMRRMDPPFVPDKAVPVVTPEELGTLLATCSSKSFVDRRDHAIIRMFVDTGMRRAELGGLVVDDIDLDDLTASVVGKGSRPRSCPLSPSTATALVRYLRERAKHSHHASPALWLGHAGPFTSDGIAQMIRRRGREAGLPNLHCHQFRHTFAHEWLAGGGTEGGLMRIGGWRSRSMLDRYGASAADERAHDEFHRLDLGARVKAR